MGRELLEGGGTGGVGRWWDGRGWKVVGWEGWWEWSFSERVAC